MNTGVQYEIIKAWATHNVYDIMQYFMLSYNSIYIQYLFSYHLQNYVLHESGSKGQIL